MELCSTLYSSLDRGEFGGEWIHVYVWLSPFPIHLKLTTLLISYEVTVIQLCPTLYNPMDCSPPGSSVHEFSRQEYWSGLPCPSPRDLPNPRIKPWSPALQADSLPTELQGKPPCILPDENNQLQKISSVQFGGSVVSNSL